MAKFKIGDRVRVLKNGGISGISVGQVVTVKDVNNGEIRGFEEIIHNNYLFDNKWYELISDPQYKPITPKVGERYRVLKTMSVFTYNPVKKGDVITFATERHDTQDRTIKGDVNYCTTEYLELVEEPELRAIHVPDKYFDPVSLHHGQFVYTKEPFNQSITTKAMNFIKSALLSKEDKTLIKAGYLNEDLSLTHTGKSALEFISFTANKKQLVTMAEEALAEDKE